MPIDYRTLLLSSPSPIQDGCTALHLLCKSLMMGAQAQADIACTMLEAGADPNANDNSGRASASYASSRALQQLLASRVASTSGGGAGGEAAAGAEQVAVWMPAMVAAKQGPSKKELVRTRAYNETETMCRPGLVHSGFARHIGNG